MKFEAVSYGNVFYLINNERQMSIWDFFPN